MAELVALFPKKHHIVLMAQQHPYASAAYRVLPQKDKTYGVEVSVFGAYPAMVTSFATKQKAEAWIKEHKRRVAESTFNSFMGRGSRLDKKRKPLIARHHQAQRRP
ncbi:MAG: hypothetical protein WBX25_22680 [Rhodomicrobium sp.]